MIPHAIDTERNLLIYPEVALRRYKHYICPNCSSRLVFKKGDINIPHFAHKSMSNCNFYDIKRIGGRGESLPHKEAKMIIKFWLEKGKTLRIINNCINKIVCSDDLIKLNEGDKVVLEYRGDDGIYDVCIFDKTDKILTIIEVFHSHSTETRPYKWFEIPAYDILFSKETTDEVILLKCVRENWCEHRQVRQKQIQEENLKKQEEKRKKEEELEQLEEKERQERQKKKEDFLKHEKEKEKLLKLEEAEIAKILELSLEKEKQRLEKEARERREKEQIRLEQVEKERKRLIQKKIRKQEQVRKNQENLCIDDRFNHCGVKLVGRKRCNDCQEYLNGINDLIRECEKKRALANK